MPENTKNHPIIILTRPQMGENIGAAARVMANFGFCELRIVAPRDGWPNEKALEMAAHAKPLVENAQLYNTVEEAIADCHSVYATTARERAMQKPVVELPLLNPLPLGEDGEAAQPQAGEGNIIDKKPSPQTSPRGRGSKTAILFGPERTGLTNEEVALADAVLTIPLAPDYPSLNLGMAVGIVCYQLSGCGGQNSGETVIPANAGTHVETSQDVVVDSGLRRNDNIRAAHGELHGLFDQLEAALDNADFWRVAEKKPTMWRNIRTSLQRADLSSQEVATWRGIVTALTKGRK